MTGITVVKSIFTRMEHRMRKRTKKIKPNLKQLSKWVSLECCVWDGCVQLIFLVSSSSTQMCSYGPQPDSNSHPLDWVKKP
jgi:hypothetical protein